MYILLGILIFHCKQTKDWLFTKWFRQPALIYDYQFIAQNLTGFWWEELIFSINNFMFAGQFQLLNVLKSDTRTINNLLPFMCVFTKSGSRRHSNLAAD